MPGWHAADVLLCYRTCGNLNAGVGVPKDITALFSRMHQYLKSCGIDGVKVDCQGAIGLAGSGVGGGPALTRRYVVFHGFRFGGRALKQMLPCTLNVAAWYTSSIS
eukprot:349801-Chlamydomonas_euryale.AAC.9